MRDGSDELLWRNIYLVGGWCTAAVILLTVLDIVIGTTVGGNLSAIPSTAAGRFAQFQGSWWMGLYNLDFLNLVSTIFMIPVFFALGAALRLSRLGPALVATSIYYIGAAVFVANNAALPMWALSQRFTAAPLELQAGLIEAGEALLAKGAHGSLGVFPGFFLLSFGTIIMATAMLDGQVFSRATAITGWLGSLLLLVYLVLVTFVPQVKSMAMLIAAPGGLLALAWMIMFGRRLFWLARTK